LWEAIENQRHACLVVRGGSTGFQFLSLTEIVESCRIMQGIVLSEENGGLKVPKAGKGIDCWVLMDVEAQSKLVH